MRSQRIRAALKVRVLLVRGATVALLAVMAAGVLVTRPAGIGPVDQNAEAALLSEVKKLTASDAQDFDNFGGSAAVSGDTAVVGAAGREAAYVFQRDEGGASSWGEVKKLTASDAFLAADLFGSSVAVSGDTAVVGAYRDDCAQFGCSNSGAAYVFQRDEGGEDNWGEVKKITASDAQTGVEFGFSVAVSGDTSVVGAQGENAGGDGAGAAYVFQRDEGGEDNWGEVKKLTASDAEAADRFGGSVAVSGDTAVVGARFKSAGVRVAAGAAYVFQRDEGGVDNWAEAKKLTASDAQERDEFGISLAVWATPPSWGHKARILGATAPAPPTSSSGMRARRIIGAR